MMEFFEAIARIYRSSHKYKALDLSAEYEDLKVD